MPSSSPHVVGACEDELGTVESDQLIQGRNILPTRADRTSAPFHHGHCRLGITCFAASSLCIVFVVQMLTTIRIVGLSDATVALRKDVSSLHSKISTKQDADSFTSALGELSAATHEGFASLRSMHSKLSTQTDAQSLSAALSELSAATHEGFASLRSMPLKQAAESLDKVHTNLDESLPDCARTRCSQYGQDEWAMNQFPHGFRGYYLDIGAHDGYIISNTLKLEQSGWHGLCVEPIPTHFSKRKCDLVREVVSDTSGQAVAFSDCSQFGTDGGDGGLSGIASPDFDRARALCKREFFVTWTMRDILQKMPGVPAVIDFVSLDVEGAELRVLSSFPFERFCGRYWVVEHKDAVSNQLAIRKLFHAQGCKVVKGPSDHIDDFFKCNCSAPASLAPTPQPSTHELPRYRLP